MASNSMKNFPLFLALIYLSSNPDVFIMTIFAYVPEENITLNCGSPDDLTAEDGRKWMADHDKDSRYSLIELEGPSKSNTFKARSQDRSSVDPVPYMTARVSRSEFTYSFRVAPGAKFIRLHFYPSQYVGRDDFDPSKAFFTVKVGRFTLLRNFSAYLTAKSIEQPGYFTKEFCIKLEENVEKLNITFLPYPSPSSENNVNSSYIFVNGIEIISMPTALYYTPPGEESPPFIGQKSNYEDYSDKALQTVHRLNVAGSTISPMQDTGMYRVWNDDSPYFIGEGFVTCNTSKRIRYTKIASYTAPEDVYRTAVIMGSNATKNAHRNLTWKLPVDPGFDYLVRLHFCEFQEWYTKAGDRVFRIYLDNQTAANTFTVILWSGGNGIPIYKDYVVNILNEDYLFVALHIRETDSVYSDVILNGIEVLKLSNYERSLAGPNPPLLAPPGSDQTLNPTTNKSKSRKSLLVIALGSGVAGLLVLLSMVCCVVFLRLRKEKRYHSSYKRKSGRSRRGSSKRLPEELCHPFSFSEIKMATNNFDQALVIGRGGFCYVYKGQIDDEFPEVAIKRLNKGLSRQGEREFEAEIRMLSQLRHIHLVSLIGYCDDDDEMILVYDYMANGTLRDHLYGTNNDPLSWKQRLEICVGAARGLNYLHAEVNNTIIHRDVKTTNILLDEKWVAKVADFGLSRLGRGDSAAVSTAVKGTFGYMDPEYAQSRQLTDKSDVYSFGVVLFEVLCARKAVDVQLEDEQRNLAQWARRCVREGKIQDIIDPFLMGNIAPECFRNFVEVAEKCVRDHRNQRPTMRDVTEKLEFALELQAKADAAKQGINPGGAYAYPKLSFHLADDNHGHEYDVLGLHGGTDFTTTVGSNTALSSFISLDTESGNRDIFSDNSNSKTQG